VRNNIRGILVIIIIGTIPLYLLGLGLLLLSPDPAAPTSTPFLTFTPLGPADTDTPGPGETDTPVDPLATSTFPGLTFLPVFTSTSPALPPTSVPPFQPLPTNTPQQLPTIAPPPSTNTPPQPPTVAPPPVINTSPPLLPPTDTPAP